MFDFGFVSVTAVVMGPEAVMGPECCSIADLMMNSMLQFVSDSKGWMELDLFHSVFGFPMDSLEAVEQRVH